jgi:hypothetical protein
VWEILTKAGIPPAPRRAGPTWSQFLPGHAEAILATDLFTVDPLDGTSTYVLAVIEHATRRIRILGVTNHPNDAWVTQTARNLLIDLDGHVDTVKFLIRDQDTKLTAAFDAVFTGAGIRILHSPIQAPRANTITEPVDRRLPTRTPEPDLDLEPAPPTTGPARVPASPQTPIARTAPSPKPPQCARCPQRSPTPTNAASVSTTRSVP